MNFYQIRLKRYPEWYIGKQNISYALRSDQLLAAWHRDRYKTVEDVMGFRLQNGKLRPSFFVSQKAARTYTDRKQVESLRRNYGFLNPEVEVNGVKYPLDTQTFSEFEVVEYPSGKIIPFDDFKS